MLRKRVVRFHSKASSFWFWFLIILAVVALLLSILFKSGLPAILSFIALVSAIGCKLLFINSLAPIAPETCVQFAGMQRSGKSFFMAREVAKQKRKMGFLVACNDRFSHYAYKDIDFQKPELGWYDLGDGTVVLYDEGNIDFDNRNASQNFKDHRTLEFFLKHGQNNNPLIFTSQGVDSLDKKIREDVMTELYWCRKYPLPLLGPLCIARKLNREISINELTGKPDIHFNFASVASAFFSRDEWLFGLPKFQNKHLYKDVVRMDFPRGSKIDSVV